jgi:hypothetical protein
VSVWLNSYVRARSNKYDAYACYDMFRHMYD